MNDYEKFYDPLVQTAGEIAEGYSISVSDVISLLLKTGRNELLVRRVLAESNDSEEAKAARASGKQFDLVAHARAMLDRAAS